ncbi:bifunctional 3-(3-hydroxy-phenyl)propionate/3-hydroxycinnamic acid hydroxylase [Antrihabitans sp. YC2-6]|uniref:bifunctional 3-(3-hydroxy-phenyl)propionate/3-hydroxycinnamic acid hydroxylase MhpA n=1 Tax=Antrihabitans sp. YC2-6 TaxID=2799498 RepID=UPI0018F5BD2F|nr:bifunctional 3-(3-hydroxy-phenyl)propionate/3-hydroxycinnamic acid hydroxylase [Antrihabitans sp. YC2-6]MBJ8348310.1 bifunctional 3-(3-hydroxy-phenyl)propionate/3-hydroxycinnamic acid hydroxylase [Antrihabitans sp. YC2-6]
MNASKLALPQHFPPIDTHPRDDVDADVVIVGYGPVGAMFANLLGQSGVRTIVLERDNTPHTLPRAGSTDDEVLRVFQAAGLVDQLLPHLDLGQSTRFISAHGEPLVTMRPSGGHNGFPQLAFFYQPDLERVLHEGVERFPHVTVRRGVRVEALHDDGDGITVWSRTADHGRQTPIRARWVVACDGGRSTVRTLCSIGFGGATYAQPWLVVDAKLEEPLADVSCFQFVGNPGRPAVTLPLPGTHHRWEFMVLPGEDHAEVATLENARRLVSPWVDPQRITILRHIVYTFHARSAARWRSGRVLLAGDAAHLMPPFAGQGLSSGMRDAHNLAWKLAAVIAGTADPAVLDTYEQERRPHVTRMTRLTRLSGALVQTRNPRGARVRDALLKVMARVPYLTEGRFKHHLQYSSGAFVATGRRGGAGHVFPQPKVRTAEGRILPLDNIMGDGWTVVGRDLDPQIHLGAKGKDVWSTLRASYVTVSRPGNRASRCEPGTIAVEDLDGYAFDFFGRHGGDFAIVRPDRIVFALTDIAGLDRVSASYHSLIGGTAAIAAHTMHSRQGGVRLA